jgi:pimeloyl-ACP methyl ester carboxylesterase
MNKLIDSLKNLFAHDKPRFIIACIQAGLPLLYILGLLFTFYRIHIGDESLPVHATDFPAQAIVILLSLGGALAFAYFRLAGNEKVTKMVLLGGAILPCVFLLWEIILYITQISVVAEYDGTVTPGFGMLLQVLIIGHMFFFALYEPIALKMILKYIPRLAAKPEIAPVVETKAE